MDWRTASTRTGRVAPKEVKATQRIATPPRRVPAGTMHAYRPGDETTACGLEIRSLQRWPNVLFRQGFHRDRCRTCREQTSGT